MRQRPKIVEYGASFFTVFHFFVFVQKVRIHTPTIRPTFVTVNFTRRLAFDAAKNVGLLLFVYTYVCVCMGVYVL